MSQNEFLITEVETQPNIESLLLNYTDSLTRLVDQACEFKGSDEYNALMDGTITDEQLAALQTERHHIYQALTTPGLFGDNSNITALDFCRETNRYLPKASFYTYILQTLDEDYFQIDGLSDGRTTMEGMINKDLQKFYKIKRLEVMPHFTSPLIIEWMKKLTTELAIPEGYAKQFIEELDGRLAVAIENYRYEDENSRLPLVNPLVKILEGEDADGNEIDIKVWAFEVVDFNGEL